MYKKTNTITSVTVAKITILIIVSTLIPTFDRNFRTCRRRRRRRRGSLLVEIGKQREIARKREGREKRERRRERE